MKFHYKPAATILAPFFLLAGANAQLDINPEPSSSPSQMPSSKPSASPSSAPTEIEASDDDCLFFEREFGSGESAAQINSRGVLGVDVDGIDFDFEFGAENDVFCKVTCDSGGETSVYLSFDTQPSTTSFDDTDSADTCTEGIVVKLEGQGGERSVGFLIDLQSGYTGLRIDCFTDSDDCGSSGGGSACFSKDSSVQVMDQGIVTMENLKAGDKVLAGNNKYEQVYSFGHLDKESSALFYQLYTEDVKKPIELTGNHLVFRDGEATRADNIQVGDTLSSGKVTKISTATKQGLYMPLTTDGTIVVDGVVASNYVSLKDEASVATETAKAYNINDQDLLHWWLAPYRMMCMGVSGNFCGNSEASYNEEGILTWLAYGQNLAKFASQQSSFVRHLMAIPMFLIFGFVIAMENMFGSSFVPTGILLVTTATFYYGKLRRERATESFLPAKKAL